MDARIHICPSCSGLLSVPRPYWHRTVTCPSCKTLYTADDTSTVHTSSPPPFSPTAPPRSPGAGSSSIVGTLFIIIGLVGAFYFLAIFDTSVYVEGNRIIEGREIHNIHKGNTRVTGAVISIGLAIVGAVLSTNCRRH